MEFFIQKDYMSLALFNFIRYLNIKTNDLTLPTKNSVLHDRKINFIVQ